MGSISPPALDFPASGDKEARPEAHIKLYPKSSPAYMGPAGLKLSDVISMNFYVTN